MIIRNEGIEIKRAIRPRKPQQLAALIGGVVLAHAVQKWVALG